MTTIYLFRQGEKENAPQMLVDQEKKLWDTKTPVRLSERGIVQAEKLKNWASLQTQETPFDLIITSDTPWSKDTAAIAFSERKIDRIDPLWNEVNLGYFEGKSPEFIKAKFAEYHHPEEIIPQNANDCLNYSFPEIEGKEKIDFEPYISTFRKRILSNILHIAEHFKGKTVAVFTQCEPIRDAVMLSHAAPDFVETAFGKALLPHLDQEKEIGVSIQRPRFKPDFTARVKLVVEEDGKIYLHETDKVNFLG